MNKTFTQKKISTPIEPKMNDEFDNEKDFSLEIESSIINNILNYSKALSIKKSKSMKHFEMVLN